MKLYRAASAGEEGIPPRSCWTPELETAEAYRDNPGFGGGYLREIESDEDILDIAAGGLQKLAEVLGYDDPREQAREWWSDNGWRYPWEESREVMRRLRESGYVWLRYVDDYPEGAITMMRIV